jgi:hypothetical protein
MSASSSTSSIAFPRLAALEHLEQYVNSSNQANAHFKSSQWLLTKSRRKGNVMMTMETAFAAGSLREDWRARHRLVDINSDTDYQEGELLDEGTLCNATSTKQNDKTTKQCIASPEWKLQAVLQEDGTISDSRIATNATGTSTIDPNTVAMGLRQRKANNETKPRDDNVDDKEVDTSAWTLIQEEDLQDEEQMLLRRDPIEFFGGLPTQELKRAQEEARQALQGYIAASNQAVMILAIINRSQ